MHSAGTKLPKEERDVRFEHYGLEAPSSPSTASTSPTVMIDDSDIDDETTTPLFTGGTRHTLNDATTSGITDMTSDVISEETTTPFTSSPLHGHIPKETEHDQNSGITLASTRPRFPEAGLPSPDCEDDQTSPSRESLPPLLSELSVLTAASLPEDILNEVCDTPRELENGLGVDIELSDELAGQARELAKFKARREEEKQNEEAALQLWRQEIHLGTSRPPKDENIPPFINADEELAKHLDHEFDPASMNPTHQDEDAELARRLQEEEDLALRGPAYDLEKDTEIAKTFQEEEEALERERESRILADEEMAWKEHSAFEREEKRRETKEKATARKAKKKESAEKKKAAAMEKRQALYQRPAFGQGSGAEREMGVGTREGELEPGGMDEATGIGGHEIQAELAVSNPELGSETATELHNGRNNVNEILQPGVPIASLDLPKASNSVVLLNIAPLTVSHHSSASGVSAERLRVKELKAALMDLEDLTPFVFVKKQSNEHWVKFRKRVGNLCSAGDFLHLLLEFSEQILWQEIKERYDDEGWEHNLDTWTDTERERWVVECDVRPDSVSAVYALEKLEEFKTRLPSFAYAALHMHFIPGASSGGTTTTHSESDPDTEVADLDSSGQSTSAHNVISIDSDDQLEAEVAELKSRRGKRALKRQAPGSCKPGNKEKQPRPNPSGNVVQSGKKYDPDEEPSQFEHDLSYERMHKRIRKYCEGRNEEERLQGRQRPIILWDPLELNKLAPNSTTLLFLYEQVCNANKSYDSTLHTIVQQLDEPVLAIQSGGLFSRARRLRSYVTNIRGFSPLPTSAEVSGIPSLTEVIDWPKERAVPPWFPAAFPHGMYNVINTKVSQSLTHLRQMRDFMKENLFKDFKVGIWKKIGEFEHLSGWKQYLPYIRKFNYVPDMQGLPRAMEVKERLRIMGFHEDHAGGYGTENLSTEANKTKFIGDTFDVSTIRYLVRPLKNLQMRGQLGPPEGITVLSLFDGICAAGVALRAEGICVRRIYLAEIDKERTRIAEAFWRSRSPHTEVIGLEALGARFSGDLSATNTFYSNEKLEEMVKTHGIHLLIGGSPCKEVSSFSRNCYQGLEGKNSSVFDQYSRIYGKLNQYIIKHKSN